MEQLFIKYQNIQLFAKYRGFTLVNEEYEEYEDFKNKMQILEYILHKFHNPKTGKNVDLYLFKHDSKFISSTQNFKKILDRYDSEHSIIMITKEELNVYRKKSIKQYKNLNLKNYLHRHFMMEMSKGPLCSPHIILTPIETKALCYGGMLHGHKLSSISESDPQNIWIGGEINDIIKIESYSEITGKTIRYRIVTPASGKVEQSPVSIVKKELDITTPLEKVVEVGEETGELENTEEYIDDYVEEIDEE